MARKRKKIPIRATQNIDILFENYSRPRLRIMVTKNETEKIAKVKIPHFFGRYRKNFTKNNYPGVITDVFIQNPDCT